jgi:exodeoxyribonuclease V alpha subunit
MSIAMPVAHLVVLVGQKKAIAIAVRNISGRRRWSKLAEWLLPEAR